jgi:hypothetical protein
MAVRVVPYIHPMYFPPYQLHKDKQGRGAPSKQETNQMSAWLYPEETWVPLSINGEVSLVTLDQVAPTLP